VPVTVQRVPGASISSTNNTLAFNDENTREKMFFEKQFNQLSIATDPQTLTSDLNQPDPAPSRRN
jgi:hypothetical protein